MSEKQTTQYLVTITGPDKSDFPRSKDVKLFINNALLQRDRQDLEVSAELFPTFPASATKASEVSAKPLPEGRYPIADFKERFNAIMTPKSPEVEAHTQRVLGKPPLPPVVELTTDDFPEAIHAIAVYPEGFSGVPRKDFTELQSGTRVALYTLARVCVVKTEKVLETEDAGK